jgi:DNA-directed RNA polymerase subunit E'/Rpb7
VSSGRRVNERTLELTDKIKGRITDTQRIELSPDLKTITITMNPAGQSKPNIFMFDRE